MGRLLFRLALIGAIVLGLGACGRKGPLYLPKPQAPAAPAQSGQ